MVINITDYFVKYKRDWLSKYDNFVLLVYVYLYRFNSIEHFVPVTIKDMVAYFRFKPDRNPGRINEKFSDAIQMLLDMGYIEFVSCYSDNKVTALNQANCNNMIWLRLINFEDADYWNPSGDFVKFNYSELDAILKIEGIKKTDKVASTYMNIKKWISAVDSNTSRFVAFPSQNRLAKDIGCSSKSIQEYVNQLISAKMLYKKNYGSFKRLLKGEEIEQNANTVYALEEKYLDGKYDKDALIEYMKFNYQMIGDDFGSFNQPLNEHQKSKTISNKEDLSMVDATNDVESVSDTIDLGDCTIDTDIVINEPKSKVENILPVKVDMNPFHEGFGQPDIEDEMPFDTSNMNPIVKPYKPFGGVFENEKKQKSIRDMDDSEFFEHMGWMENQVEDDEDNEIDIASVGTESNDLDWDDEDIDELLFGA